jgi:hypothetical protein
MQNTLTQKFTAYTHIPFRDDLLIRTMNHDNYVDVKYMLMVDMEEGLVPKHICQGMLEQMSAIMN